MTRIIFPLRAGIATGDAGTSKGICRAQSYFFLAAALCGGTVRVTNTNFWTHQGDVRFLRYLKELGCGVAATDQSGSKCRGKAHRGRLHGLHGGPRHGAHPCRPCGPAPGRTIIRNVAHLRIKESNRLEALVRELAKTGIRAEEPATASSSREARRAEPRSRPTTITGSP